MNTDLGIEEYELNAWINRLGSVPTARIAYKNFYLETFDKWKKENGSQKEIKL